MTRGVRPVRVHRSLSFRCVMISSCNLDPENRSSWGEGEPESDRENLY